MQTNELKDPVMELLFFLKAESLQLYQNYPPLQIFYKILLRLLAIYSAFLNILGTFIAQSTYQSQYLTVVRFSKYLFPKLQYIFRATDYGLRKPKMSKVFFFFNWNSPHARLNSHYEAWSYKKKKHKKDYRIQKICSERTCS